MDIFDKGFFTILACNSLCGLLAIPLILGRVPRNPVFGFRTCATMGDEALWFQANAYFGLNLVMACIVGTVLAMLLHTWWRPSPDSYLSLTVLLLVLPPAAAILRTLGFIQGYQTNRSDDSHAMRQSQ